MMRCSRDRMNCRRDSHGWAVRKGLAQLEIVMISGATIPLAAAMFFMAIEAFQYLYSLVSTLLSWTCL